jgi:hypothetical protein
MFTPNDLLALLHMRPFVPFRLVMSDGSVVDVRSAEVVSPGRRFAMVGLLDPDATDTLFDRWTVVWYMHVTRVETLVPGSPPFTSAAGPTGSPAPSPS